jgi:hypothetical protein
MAPVHLLVLSTHLISSTLVCLIEVIYTEDWPRETINKNIPGYVSFLIVGRSQFAHAPTLTHFLLGFIMWFDMFRRVKLALNSKLKTV